jgi:hypothetical protein
LEIEQDCDNEADRAEKDSGPGETVAKRFGVGEGWIDFGKLIKRDNTQNDSRDFGEPENAEVNETENAEDEGDDGKRISLGDPVGVGLGFEVVPWGWAAEEGHGGIVRGEGWDENT